LSCDGKRPCTRCIQRGKECFEYDKALHQSKQPKKRKSRGSTQQQQLLINATIAHLSTSKLNGDQLVTNNTPSKEELLRNNQEIQYLRQQNAYLQKQLQQLQPRNDFSIDLWNPPTALQLPIMIVDASTLQLVGANKGFYELFQYSEDLVRSSNFNMHNIFPANAASQWSAMTSWILSSCYKIFQSRSIVQNSRGEQMCTRIASHFHRSFVWVEWEVSEEFSDEFIIDDMIIPSTFRMPAKQVPQNPVLPLDTFTKLLDIFCNTKQKLSVYSDTKQVQHQTIQQLRTLTLQFKVYQQQQQQQQQPVYPEATTITVYNQQHHHHEVSSESTSSIYTIIEELSHGDTDNNFNVVNEDNSLNNSDLLEILEQYEQETFTTAGNNSSNNNQYI
jgi:hypothetical protein